MRWLWPALAGCIDFGLDPIESGDPPQRFATAVDEFDQVALPAVDLLFVVDDTASMAQEQLALAEAFDALAGSLEGAGVAWQAGVTTVGMTAPDAGWLRGSPYVMSASDPGAAAAFEAIVQVGTTGAGPEAGLAAAVTALDLAAPGGPNAGFLRPDAALHVVFVSDADDQSDAWLGDDPVGAFLRALEDDAMTGLPAVASAIVGDVPAGCSSSTGTAVAGTRYHAVVAATGGVSGSVCDADFGDVLATLGGESITWPVRFPLDATPVAGSVKVRVEGELVRGGYAVEPDPPAVVFDVPPDPGVHLAVTYLVELP